MAIKYFKYCKSTLPAIQAGMIEVYGESSQHVSKDLLAKYEGLKIGIGFIPAWIAGWTEQSRFIDCQGVYITKDKTVWIATANQNGEQIEVTIRHELLHACQYLSLHISAHIMEIAKNSPKWEECVKLVDQYYSYDKRIVEYPVWTLQHEEKTCDYFIRKYLR